MEVLLGRRLLTPHRHVHMSFLIHGAHKCHYGFFALASVWGENRTSLASSSFLLNVFISLIKPEWEGYHKLMILLLEREQRLSSDLFADI